MLFDERYKYSTIDKTQFDMKYLESKQSCGHISKYILVYYKDNSGQIKTKENYYPNINNSNVIVKYYIEEIDATDTPFEGEYSYSKYYYILNLGYIHEFLYLPNYCEDVNGAEDEEVKKLIHIYDSEWCTFEVDEGKMFGN